MREIVTRYDGECRACGAEIGAGATVVYERRVGVFCPPCAPTDPEEIRALREDAAGRKAERLEGWAAKREQRAQAVLNPGENHYSRDWAFITQPGHIPARARFNRAVEREAASVQKAREMRGRAASLRAGVRVKGDAEAKREQYREFIRGRLRVGMVVETTFYGPSELLKINRKSVRIRTQRFGSEMTLDLNYIGAEVVSAS
jgi:hypothetical protein